MDKILQEICLRSISHNQRIKEYPQGFVEVLSCSRPIFREPHEQLSNKPTASKGDCDIAKLLQHEQVDEDRKSENVARAVRRAKQTLRDLALCNNMRYFVTLTLDPSLIDRHDMTEITRKLNNWCSNQVQRNGLAYILVPERHKDGAVHFHGFVNGAVDVVDSGTMAVPWSKKPRKPRSKAQRSEWLAKGGKVVYNLPQWPLGFTTAIELYGDPVAAVNYCCKYVGKQQEGDCPGEAGAKSLPEKIGGRWFYHGGCNALPKVQYFDIDFDNLELMEGAFAWEVPTANAIFVKEILNL